MSDEKDAITQGLVGVGTVNKSGNGIDLAGSQIVAPEQVIFYTAERFDEDGNAIIQGADLLDVLNPLYEYQKQGVYVDRTDNPKNYINVDE